MIAPQRSPFGWKFFTVFVAFLSSTASFLRASPLEESGRLRVDGLQLVNSHGQPIQLRGVSTQGTQFMPWGDCPNPDSLRMAADVMGASIYRIPTYITQKGYGTPAARPGLMDTLDKIITETQKLGLYAVIDWHVTSFNPTKEPYFSEAKEFFTAVAARYGGRPNILYELCNEPRFNTPWSDIKKYAQAIIPIIRAKDPTGIIIVGSPDDSGDLSSAASDPLVNEKGARLSNVMYSLHFYAGTHEGDITRFTNFANKLPIIVTEWGAASDSGDVPDSYPTTEKFAAALAGENSARVKVSWIAWSFTHDRESSAMLKSCSGPWDASNLTPWGLWVRSRIICLP